MALRNGYGVLMGKVEDHYIDPVDNEGRWPHYHIKVRTPNGIFESAINLKSRTQTRVEYRDFRSVDRSYFQSILKKSDGLHRLVSNSASGALDIIRHPGLKDPLFDNDGSNGTSNLRCKCTD